MIEVTKDEIRSAINDLINDTTYYNELLYPSMEQAIDKLVNDKFLIINDFSELSQEMIDDQADDYDGYLDGAKVGNLVWGDTEMWVSQLTIEGWATQESNCEHEDIAKIADIVETDLILKALSEHNKNQA